MRYLTLILLPLIIGCSESTNNKEPVKKEHIVEIGSELNETTPEKVALGEKLFFDVNLSKNKNISCASCHNPEFAFADTISVNEGTNGSLGFRNPPSLANVGLKTKFHLDGGVRNLELQAMVPIFDSLEMGQSFDKLIEYIQTDSTYIQLFAEAFDSVPTIFGLTRALASYQRSLIFHDSPYDNYMNGDSSALSSSQIRGLNLFHSERLNCSTCHTGKLLTDENFYSLGIHPKKSDIGRARVTTKTEDEGKFMTPTLRNIMVTSPYLHDGSIATIEEVLTLLQKGGGPHENKSELIKAFTLTRQEKEDLLAFFQSLTDPAFKK